MAGMENEFIVRLVAAAVLGSLLGLERSLSGKHAGMRTYALVSLGSCLFVVIGILSSFQLSMFAGLNPVGIASSVVIGIGFIGAGLSALRGEHPELTTASGIWLAAGVGMAAGFGFYTTAVTATILGFVVFWVFAKFEHHMSVRYGIKHEG
ncbi:MgtC/SapB family protein [Candidatus Kaiserbacteria bacterium]|nr:MgtC/SapB family protein [Candidatus Kaiserbacteria bacterium]